MKNTPVAPTRPTALTRSELIAMIDTIHTVLDGYTLPAQSAECHDPDTITHLRRLRDGRAKLEQLLDALG